MSFSRFERLRALDKSENPADARARDELRGLIVEDHRALVVSVAVEMCPQLGFHASNDLEDLVGEGNLALVRAIDRFDLERGVTFANFAARAIKGALRQYKRDKSQMIREPAWHQEKRAKTGEAAPVVGVCAGLPGQSDDEGFVGPLDRGCHSDTDAVLDCEARLVMTQFLDCLENAAYQVSGWHRDQLLKQHAVLKLHFAGRLTGEIAATLKISELSVCCFIQQGREQFAQWIGRGE